MTVPDMELTKLLYAKPEEILYDFAALYCVYRQNRELYRLCRLPLFFKRAADLSRTNCIMNFNPWENKL